MTRAKAVLVGLALVLMLAPVAWAEDDPLVGQWVTEGGKSRVEVSKGDDGTYSGKIVWLKEPNEPDTGKAKVDEHNPDPAKQNQPILGIEVLSGLKASGENKWDSGTIYDPESGKAYKCRMTLKDDTLDVRGFIGVSLIGRTTTWTLYTPSAGEAESAG